MKSKRITTRLESKRNQMDFEKKKRHISTMSLNIYSFSFYMFALVIMMFLSTEFANAQEEAVPQGSGYLVQPGQIGINVIPRQKFEGELRIHNFSEEDDLRLQFKIIELTQRENGDWLPFDTDPNSKFDYYPGLSLTDHKSCAAWIKLEKDEIVVAPNSDGIINLTISTPYNAKSGFYGAAIMSSLKVRENEIEQVPMYIRTGIPVTANVRNTNTAPKVRIDDIGMEFVPTLDTSSGTVKLKMTVKNEGKTFSRVNPVIRVRGLIGDHWKLITTHKFGDVGIIPGVTLYLESDIKKSLPSGKYQLDAIMYVDERLRGKSSRMGKEIDFEGDPLITKTAFDVPLDLEPKEIIFSMRPGLKRPEYLKVHAAIDERIIVKPILRVPKAFEGIADNNLKIADAMTCMDWLTLTPENLTIENFRTRTFAINAEFPEDALQYPNYYAALGLEVMYADGQSAGTEWLNICVENENAIKNPEITCSSIGLEEDNGINSDYIIQASYKNIGNTHVFPTSVKAAVVQAEGYGWTSGLLTTNNIGMFIPYETRRYNGVLDFSSVDPDEYNLEVLMEYPPNKKVARQVRIRVKEEDGRKIPEIINQTVNEIIEVKWY